ncbi:MAG: hypothetical protein PHT07_02725 [Paludibacter sp.]|nr:hypothetical protein [Paludibacter sp.]
MKNLHQHLMRTITLLMLVMVVLQLDAVKRRFAPLAPSAISEYQYTIANDIQVSDRVLEFDLFIQDTNPDQAFELAAIQCGITVDPNIYNGGIVTAAILPGTSQFTNSRQYPTNIIFSQADNVLKIAPRGAPGKGNGSIISTTSPGTRICRVRLTNTVPFKEKSNANLTFCFTTSPYPTKVAQYISGLNTVLTSNATNSFSKASITALNQTLTSYGVSIYSKDKNILVTCSQKAKQVAVYNTLGSMIMMENNVIGLKKFEMFNYPNEYYFVKIVTDNDVYTQKVLLK